jgi:hypothetical protein
MFNGAEKFNQPIGDWEFKKLTTTIAMFKNSKSFNQPIEDWNLSKVIKTSYMFEDANSFNQSVGDWNISNVRSMKNMFKGVTLSSDNYDDILIKWNNLSLRKNINFHAGESRYSQDGKEARESIINKFLWTITDGGEI